MAITAADQGVLVTRLEDLGALEAAPFLFGMLERLRTDLLPLAPVLAESADWTLDVAWALLRGHHRKTSEEVEYAYFEELMGPGQDPFQAKSLRAVSMFQGHTVPSEHFDATTRILEVFALVFEGFGWGFIDPDSMAEYQYASFGDVRATVSYFRRVPDVSGVALTEFVDALHGLGRDRPAYGRREIVPYLPLLGVAPGR